MEKRLYERYPTNVAASALLAGGESVPCVIRDFCDGGLFLELIHPQQASRSRGRGKMRDGAPIEIRFPAPPIPGHPAMRLQARVARAESSGFGVAFRPGDPDAPRAVSALRRLSTAPGGPETPRSAAKRAAHSPRLRDLFDSTIRMFSDILRSHCASLFASAQQAMFDAAAKAPDSQTGQEYFRASEIAKSEAGSIQTAWLDRLASQMPTSNGAVRARAHLPRAELELVDKTRFDEWVLLAGLASRIEASVHQELYALERRLAYLTGEIISKETDPIGPSAVVRSLSQALEPFNLRLEVHRALLRSLEDELRRVLGSAYTSINAELGAKGVPVDIERQPLGAAGRAPPAAAPAARPHWQPNAMAAMADVLSFPQRPARHQGPAGERGPAPSGQATAYRRQQVLGALSELQLTRNRPLPLEVEATLKRSDGSGSEPSALSSELSSILSVAEQLVESFKSDDGIGALLGPPVERIEVPLARVAVEHPDFVRDPHNPAVAVVNNLGRLALALSAEPPNARRSSEVSALISRVSESLAQDGGPSLAAFAEARDALDPYVHEYEELFSRNLQRVIDVCDGQERLGAAKQAVRQALAPILGTKPVPTVANDLLLLGWPALLTLTWLDQGPESPEWSDYLDALSTLLRLLATPSDDTPARAQQLEATLNSLEQGLAVVPYDPVRQRALIERLRTGLAGDAHAFRALVQPRAPANLSMLDPAPAGDGPPAPSPEQAKAVATWLPTIRSVTRGDWLVERAARNLSRPISLAWTSPRADRFVFVDGRGFKALERALAELAGDFESGRITLLEDGRLPLVERAIQRVLGHSYDEVVYDSAHDTLTGLINRRSFETQIDEAVQRARTDHGRNVLLTLDLDRFKLVNDLAGHEGGDRLLKEVTAVIRTQLSTSSVVARTGDDEFGILLPDCGRDAGYEVAENQRRAIEDMDFRMEGRPFPISASIGLVDIDEHSVSASRVLMQAGSACFLAKEAGRNRTKVFEATDTDVRRHQGTVQNLPIIEEALHEDRLQLFLQLIKPVFVDGGLHEHYEVLLRVIDKAGHATSPEELILAAEQYDRMRSLDRWVVERVFRWIDDHAQILERIGGLSINLSGHSLGDTPMLELILQSLERTAVPRGKIAFEITETAMVRNFAAAQAFVERLKEAGCRLYLDDFGTGMSSYSYLKRFPVDCVKIDGSFVRTIATDDKDLALVRSITEIAHFSQRLVIAEQVETEAVLARLREIGVDFAQGYAIGRPFPIDRLLSV